MFCHLVATVEVAEADRIEVVDGTLGANEPDRGIDQDAREAFGLEQLVQAEFVIHDVGTTALFHASAAGEGLFDVLGWRSAFRGRHGDVCVGDVAT